MRTYDEERARHPFTIREPRLLSLTGVLGGILLALLGMASLFIFMLLRTQHRTAGLLSFWGSVLGGAISGVGTLAGVIVTFDWRNRNEIQRTYHRLIRHFGLYLSTFESAAAFLYAVMQGPYYDTNLEEVVRLSHVLDPSPVVHRLREQRASLVAESRTLTTALDAFAEQLETVWPTLFPSNSAKRFPRVEPEHRRTFVAAALGLLAEVMAVNSELHGM